MRAALLAVCLALVGSVSDARASRRLLAQLEGCSNWSVGELERLAQLELQTVGGGESDVGSADVAIECVGANVTITARESFGRQKLTRQVELEPDAEDGQRLLAISVAQLVRALDWLPQEQPPPAPRPRPANDRQPALLARPEFRRLELNLGAGPRARQLMPALTTLRAELAGNYRFARRLSLGAGLSYERGNTSRRQGQVSAKLAGMNLQAGFDPWHGQRWSCLLRLELAVQHLTLEGLGPSIGVRAGRVRGFGGEIEVDAGPVLRWDGVGIALLAQGGAARFGGYGLVSDDDPVSLNGAWAGAALALLWAP